MPFDGTTETPAIRRARLIDALRQPMPRNITFSYMTVRCGSQVCALGLASLMWPQHEEMLAGDVRYLEQQAAFFGLSVTDTSNIFWGQGGIYNYRPKGARITPAMIADALEKTG